MKVQDVIGDERRGSKKRKGSKKGDRRRVQRVVETQAEAPDASGYPQAHVPGSPKAAPQGAPAQQVMSGPDSEVDLTQVAAATGRRKTIDWDEHLVVREPVCGTPCCCVDAACEACCYQKCCRWTEYRITNKGMKVHRNDACGCGSEINNVDWTSLEAVDHAADCRFGYVHVDSRDSKMGDFTIKVHRGREPQVHQALLNLCSGDDFQAGKEVVREFRGAPTCCEPPCPGCRTHYSITKRALRVTEESCLPCCCGYSSNSFRWLSSFGGNVITDIDYESGCCYGSVHVVTQAKEDRFKFFTIRVWKNDVEAVAQTLRTTSGWKKGEEMIYDRFMEATIPGCGPCCVYCQPLYVVSSRGLSIQRRHPCCKSTDYVEWRRVLDVDSEERCCLGRLDLQMMNSVEGKTELQDLRMLVWKTKFRELRNVIRNLAAGQDVGDEDAIFNHFEEATCCPWFWNHRVCGNTRYVLRKSGFEMDVPSSTGPCSGCYSKSYHTKWARVRDVDYSTWCCFGYVTLHTSDEDVDVKTLRVRRAQAYNVSAQILNRMAGFAHDVVREIYSSVAQADCHSICCPGCCATGYLLTDRAVQIKNTCCGTTTVDNISWEQVREIDAVGRCCCADIYLAFSKTPLKDQDRFEGASGAERQAGENAAGKACENYLQNNTLRVFAPSFKDFYRTTTRLRAGKKPDDPANPPFQFESRDWCQMCFCYKGYCWCYNPVEYVVSDDGFDVKRLHACCALNGICLSRWDHIPWHQVREVNQSKRCCWGHLNVHTLDEDCREIDVQLTKGELEDVVTRMRTKRTPPMAVKKKMTCPCSFARRVLSSHFAGRLGLALGVVPCP